MMAVRRGTTRKAAVKDTPKRKSVSITLPTRFSQQQILYTLLLVASFLLGYLLATVQHLQAPTAKVAETTNQGAAAAFTNDDIKAWAKDAGLDTNKFNSCFDKSTYQAKIDEDEKAGGAAGVSGTPSFFVNGHLVVGALPADVFAKMIDFEANGGDWTNPEALVSDPVTATFVDGDESNGEFGKTAVDVDTGHLPVLGKDSAPITIVEFSDLECPFCAQFFKTAFPTLKKDYIDTGKVKMYYRHYPLPFHAMAKPYANAVECANEQGKFWELHDSIFGKQP